MAWEGHLDILGADALLVRRETMSACGPNEEKVKHIKLPVDKGRAEIYLSGDFISVPALLVLPVSVSDGQHLYEWLSWLPFPNVWRRFAEVRASPQLLHLAFPSPAVRLLPCHPPTRAGLPVSRVVVLFCVGERAGHGDGVRDTKTWRA